VQKLVSTGGASFPDMYGRHNPQWLPSSAYLLLGLGIPFSSLASVDFLARKVCAVRTRSAGPIPLSLLVHAHLQSVTCTYLKMLTRRAPSQKALSISIAVFVLIVIYSFRHDWHTPPFSNLGIDSGVLNHWPGLGSHGKASDLSDLRQLCEETTWTEGLWIQCHSGAAKDPEGKYSFHGGLNNARNRLQTCLRLGIDAGAGVVIPWVATRNQNALKSLGRGAPVPITNFWDMEYMTGFLGTQCPQLGVRFDVKGFKRVVEAPFRDYKLARYHTGTFRGMTAAALAKANVTSASITAETPVALLFGDTFTAWDYESSGELGTIRKDLFKALLYNQTLLGISTSIFELPELKDGYIGVHLRAESDWPGSYGTFQQQVEMYMAEMKLIKGKSGGELTAVYVSCGKQESIQIFRDKLKPLGYKVHDKWSLLANDPKTLERVENLLFDDKAIVEYQILLKSDFFLGPVMSTMSSLIAYARALDDPGNFFPTHIFPGSTKDPGVDGWGMRRTYPQVPVMKGDGKSMLMVVDGDDIMAYFP